MASWAMARAAGTEAKLGPSGGDRREKTPAPSGRCRGLRTTGESQAVSATGSVRGLFSEIVDLAVRLAALIPAGSLEGVVGDRSEEHTSELQSLITISYA